MWISMHEMASHAEGGRHALGAFHAANLEQVQGVLEAAVEERAPVILVLDQRSAMYAGLEVFVSVAKKLADDVPVPAAVMLEHVQDLDFIGQALRLGYTGIGVDFQPFAHDPERLARLRDAFKREGAFFEMFLDNTAPATPVILEETLARVLELGPDSLCLSLSGPDKEEPVDQIFEAVSGLREATNLMVALAGAGAWKDKHLKKAVEAGVWKLSVGTRTNRAFTKGLREFLDKNPDRVNPLSYMPAAREAFRAEVRNCLQLFGASGLA